MESCRQHRDRLETLESEARSRDDDVQTRSLHEAVREARGEAKERGEGLRHALELLHERTAQLEALKREVEQGRERARALEIQLKEGTHDLFRQFVELRDELKSSLTACATNGRGERERGRERTVERASAGSREACRGGDGDGGTDGTDTDTDDEGTSALVRTRMVIVTTTVVTEANAMAEERGAQGEFRCPTTLRHISIGERPGRERNAEYARGRLVQNRAAVHFVTTLRTCIRM